VEYLAQRLGSHRGHSVLASFDHGRFEANTGRVRSTFAQSTEELSSSDAGVTARQDRGRSGKLDETVRCGGSVAEDPGGLFERKGPRGCGRT